MNQDSTSKILTSPLVEELKIILEKLNLQTHKKNKNPYPFKIPQPVEKKESKQTVELIKMLAKLIKDGQVASLETLNKNIVILLGKTGAGKSTFTHFLKGNKMSIRTRTESSQGIKINDKSKVKYELKSEGKIQGSDIGETQNSQTKLINLIQINDQSDFYLTDTPGLFDTTGFIFNIANTISLQKAFHNAKTVRTIIVIKEQGTIYGDQKGSNLIKLIQQIVGYLENMSIEQFAPTATIIISHTSYSSADITAKLKSILSAERNQSMCSNLKNKQKVDKFMELMILGSQINQRKQLMESLSEKLNQNKQEMDEIKKKVDFSVIKDLQAKLKKEQTTLQKKKIELQKDEYQEQEDYQQRLKKLNKIISKISSIIKQIKQKIDQENAKYKFQFQKISQIQLNHDKLIQKQKKFKSEFEDFQKKIEKNPSFNDVIRLTVQKVIDPDQSKNLLNSIINCPKVYDPKNKFKMSIKFDDLVKLQNIMLQIKNDIYSLFQQNRIEDIAEKFSQIQYLSLFVKAEFIERTKTECSKIIENRIKSIAQTFNTTTLNSMKEGALLSQQNIKIIQKCFLNIQSAKNIIEKIPNLKKFQTVYSFNGFVSSFRRNYENLCKNVIQKLNEKDSIHRLLISIKNLESFYLQFGNFIQEIKKSYQNFSNQFCDIIQKSLESVVKAIRQATYLELPKHFNFLKQVQQMAKRHFEVEIQENYNQLKQLCNRSLQLRIKNGFSEMIKNISINNVKQIELQIKNVSKLRQQADLIKIIGKEALDQSVESTLKQLQQICLRLISQIKEFIKRNDLDKLKDKMILLKQLRGCDDTVALKTSEEYSKFLSRFQSDISMKSKDEVNRIIKKVKLGEVEKQDVQIIKQTITKLQKMEWLQKSLGVQGIQQIIISTKTTLKEQAQQIFNQIQNIFHRDIEQYQQNQIQQMDDEFSDVQSLKGFSVMSSRVKKGRCFVKLNSSIQFVKNLCEADKQLKPIFIQLKQKVKIILQKQAQEMNTKFSTNKQNLSLHSIQLDRFINKLLCFKMISKEIQNSKSQQSLDNFVFEIKNYFQDRQRQITDFDLTKQEQLKKTLLTSIKLLKILQPVRTYLSRKGLNISDFQSNFRKILMQKFSDIEEEIDELINNSKLNEVKSRLQILKKYRNSNIDEFLSRSRNENDRSYLSAKFQQFSQRYNTQLKDVPAKIDQMFRSYQFDNMAEAIDQIKKNGKQQLARTVINKIQTYIQQTYENLVDSVSNLAEANQVQLNTINKELKKFESYKKISHLVKNMQFDSKRLQIIELINDFYNNKKQDIEQSINNRSFKNIKTKIQSLNAFIKTISKGINHINELKIQIINFEKKINDQVDAITKQSFSTEYGKYFGNISKLKVFDQQYNNKKECHQTESFLYQTRLKNHIISQINNFNKQINDSKDIKQFDKLQKKFYDYKTSVYQFIGLYPEFKPVQIQFDEMTKNSRQIAKSLIDDDKFNPQYLQRLRTEKRSDFNLRIQQIKADYKKIIIKKQQDFKNKNYQTIVSIIKNLKKFTPIKHYLGNIYKQDQTKKQILNRQRILRSSNKQSIKYAKIKNYDNFKNFEEYFKILMYFDFDQTQDQKIIQDIRIFHQQILVCLSQLIPQTNDKSIISEIKYKAQIISNHQNFISTLKKYTNQMSAIHKLSIYAPSNFQKDITSIADADTYQKQVSQQIKKYDSTFNQLWENNQFKIMSDILTDLKSSKSSQTTQAYEKLGNKVKSLILTTGKTAVDKVQQKQFQGVNDKINKVQHSENEFKNFDGLVSKQNPVYNQVMKKINNFLESNYVNSAVQSLDNKQKAPDAVKKIIQIKKLVHSIPALEKTADQHLKNILQVAKAKKATNLIVKNFKQISKDKQNSLAASICQQIMVSYQKQLAIPRLLPPLTMTIQDAIEKFRGQKDDSIDKKELLRMYNIYQKQFKQLIQTYLNESSRNQIQKNLSKIKSLALQILQKLQNSDTQQHQSKEFIPILLARIFAFISLHKSGDSFYDARDANENQSLYLLQPHPIQVLSILRFIGCENKTTRLQKSEGGPKGLFLNLKQMENHLMQILTGEGKSIILGTMSLILALFGNEVYCVCYSTFLSQRDNNSFKEIFEAFEVTSLIKYGTFSLISQLIINQQGDVRKIVDTLFTTKSVKKSQNQEPRSKNRILLIDQVDTFFSKDFYGETYNPCTLLKETNIIEIIKLIWANKNDNKTVIQNKLKASPHYNNIRTLFSDCLQKLDIQFSVMIDDVKTFKSRQYVVQDNRIGYKQLDGISFNIVISYETMFLYMYERERNNVNDEALNQNLGITLKCGNYSYAQIIQNGFDKIFGVTGTLQNLNDFEKNILKRYNITGKTFAPSVYGKSNRFFEPILIQDEQPQYYQTLASTINRAKNAKKPVLVFFKDQGALDKFVNSPYCAHFKDKLNIVTQKSYDRDFYIKKATQSEQITFFTATFGRGTDFIIFNPIVKQIGFLVVQSFLSQEKSEQIQIKGRTARQGTKGFYQLILNFQSIQKEFKITKNEIEKARQTATESLSELIDIKRTQYLKIANQQRQKTVKQAQIAHNQSIKKRNLMLNNQLNRNDNFFWIMPQGREGQNTQFIFAIDASGSMGGKPWQDQLNSLKGILSQIGKGITNTASVLVFDDYCHPYCINQNPNSIDTTKIRFTGGGTTPDPTFLKAAEIARNINQKEPKNIYFFYISDGGACHPRNGIDSLLKLKQQLAAKKLSFNYTSILIGNCSSGKSCMQLINKQMGGKSQYVADAGALLQKVTEVLRR